MSLFRPNIDNLAGYTPGEQPQQPQKVVKLNTNENPYPPSPHVIEAIHRAAGDRLRFYPDPVANSFRDAAAEVLGVDRNNIIACNGSDDALTILTRACVSTDDLMVAPTPSYPLYKVLAEIQGCRFEFRAFTDDWQLPTHFCEGAKLTFVPNPNSPTGTFMSPESLLEASQRSNGIVVSDEAYGDFAPSNCVPFVRDSQRLVVTRTLSKSYGLAGLRFGFLVAPEKITSKLLQVKDSYNVDALSIAAATAAIRDQEYFENTRDKIITTRTRMEATLSELGFQVTPSHANFVWCQRTQPVEPIYAALKDQGIFIRYLKYDGFGEGLRISVGTDEEVDTLFDALRKLV